MPNAPVTVTAARCLRCEWKTGGDPAVVDKAAEKHTSAGHPTAVVTEVTR